MKYLGIDSSTYTALVCVDNVTNPFAPTTRSRLLHFDNKTGWDRVQSIATGVDSFLSELSETCGLPKVVCIEGYTTHRASNIALLVAIGTIIRSVLHQRGLQWYSIPPSTLKLWTCGKGPRLKSKESKKLMKSRVKERWGFSSQSDDIIDAFALAKLAEEADLLGFNKNLKGVLKCN